MLSGVATGSSVSLSGIARDATDATREIVSADETDGEIDVVESNGKTGLVSSGDRRKNCWLKTASRVCRTNASPDEIYLLGEILGLSGSMFWCLNERDKRKGVSRLAVPCLCESQHELC